MKEQLIEHGERYRNSLWSAVVLQYLKCRLLYTSHFRRSCSCKMYLSTCPVKGDFSHDQRHLVFFSWFSTHDVELFVNFTQEVFNNLLLFVLWVILLDLLHIRKYWRTAAKWTSSNPVLAEGGWWGKSCPGIRSFQKAIKSSWLSFTKYHTWLYVDSVDCYKLVKNLYHITGGQML